MEGSGREASRGGHGRARDGLAGGGGGTEAPGRRRGPVAKSLNQSQLGWQEAETTRDHKPRGQRPGSVRARHGQRSLRCDPSALQPGRLRARTLCPQAQAVGLQDRASGPGSCYSRAPGLLPWGSPMPSDKTRPPTLTAHGARSPGLFQPRARDRAFPPGAWQPLTVGREGQRLCGPPAVRHVPQTHRPVPGGAGQD